MNRLVIAAALLALGAGACASEEKAPEPQAPAPAGAPVTLQGKVDNRGVKDLTSGGAGVSFEMEAGDNYFDPTFIKVAPGAAVEVTVLQEGQAVHTFSIDAPAVSPAVDVTLEKKGERKTVTFTLPAGGVVNFYCRFHRELGMQGAFYFQDG